MLELHSVDIFNNSKIILERRETTFYKKYIITIFVIIAFLIVSIINYKYDKVLEINGVIKEGFILVYVPKLKLSKIQNNEVLVNNKKYKINILNVSEELMDVNYNIYHEIKINIKGLNKKELINNKIVNMSLILEKTTIIKQVLKNIEKGLDKS